MASPPLELAIEVVAKSPALAGARPSALVAEVSTLTSRQRAVLGVTDWQLGVADLLFRVCVILVTDDAASLADRLDELEDAADELQRNLPPGAVASVVETWAESPPDLPKWLRRATSPGFQRFLRRFVGAARYDRLTVALRSDGALVAVGARRALRYLLPVAVATDRCIRTLSPTQQSEIEGLGRLADSSLLEMAVTFDSALSRFLDDGLIPEVGVARPDELQDLSGAIGDIGRVMSERVSAESARLIADLSDALARKVQGARDALKYSSDPVSQAANSAIELIDRLLRDAFPPSEVLQWVSKHLPGRDDMTWERDGTVAPTKRAQALCFAYAAGDVKEASLIHELFAASITSIRNNLQQLKHADTGSEEEATAVLEWIVALESTLLLACKFAWLGADENQLELLRGRLAARTR